MIQYKKTENPNVIKRIKIIEDEIYIDRLKLEIENLRKQLKYIPKPKTKPDQETLDFWNEMMPLTDVEHIERELKRKEELLEQLRKL